jgi:hypothetical protein
MTFVPTALCLTVTTALLTALPARALDATHLAVIINTSDPLSVRIGEYYAAQRRISFQNIIRVAFPPDKTTLTREEFEDIKAIVDKKAMHRIQALALTWAAPYRVECMSITSAFAFGYDPAFCEPGCKPTRPSPYYNSPASPALCPTGHATCDGDRGDQLRACQGTDRSRRRVRRPVPEPAPPTCYRHRIPPVTCAALSYQTARRVIDGRVPVSILEQDSLEGASDVLFYFTGKQVPFKACRPSGSFPAPSPTTSPPPAETFPGTTVAR